MQLHFWYSKIISHSIIELKSIFGSFKVWQLSFSFWKKFMTKILIYFSPSLYTLMRERRKQRLIILIKQLIYLHVSWFIFMHCHKQRHMHDIIDISVRAVIEIIAGRYNLDELLQLHNRLCIRSRIKARRRPHHRRLTLYQHSFVPNSQDRIFYYRYRAIRIETAFCLRVPPSGLFFPDLGPACLKPLWSLEEGRGQWDTPPAYTCTAPVFGSCISATCTRSLPPSFASHIPVLLPPIPLYHRAKFWLDICRRRWFGKLTVCLKEKFLLIN